MKTIINLDSNQHTSSNNTALALAIPEETNQNQADILNTIIFRGTRRYYPEDLTQRDYFLENVTPHELRIMGRIIKSSAWTNLLYQTAALLLELFPNTKTTIFDFSCSWTKATIFSYEQKTNFKFVTEGIYINCNHTALHSCWLLQDLLDFFEIDKSSVYFIVHRPPSAEPKAILECIEKQFKKAFVDYICTSYQKTEAYANKIISRIEKYLNPLLKQISRSYTNLFLFDNNATMSQYVEKIRNNVNKVLWDNPKTKTALNKSLDYLVEFYKNKKISFKQ